MGVNINKSRRIADIFFYGVEETGGGQGGDVTSLELDFEGKKYVYVKNVPSGADYIVVNGKNFVSEEVINNG